MPAIDKSSVFQLLSILPLRHHGVPGYQSEVDRLDHVGCATIYAQPLLNPRVQVWKTRHFLPTGELKVEFAITIQNREVLTKELKQV
jgi:hypothetical protein